MMYVKIKLFENDALLGEGIGQIYISVFIVSKDGLMIDFD